MYKRRVNHFIFLMLYILILSPISTNIQVVAAEASTDTGEKVLNQDMIDRFMKLINDFRAEECLPPVSYNYEIQDGMDIRAEELVQKLDHERPNGEGPWTAFPSDVDFRLENIAGGYSPESVFEAWKASEGHRNNMLTSNLESIGLGPHGSDGLYWVLVGTGSTSYKTNIEEISEVIDYETIINENPELDQGVEKVIQEGQNGSKTINYKQYLDSEDKVVFQCAKTESEVKEPVKKIVEVGTKITEIKEEVKEIELPFKTIEQEDPTLEKGEKVVQQEGKNGQEVITYNVTYENGKEVSRKVINKEAIESVDEIVLIGTKVNEVPVVKEDKEKQEESNPIITDDEVKNNETPIISGEEVVKTADGEKLPETATTVFEKLLIGAILLGVGGALYFTRRKEVIE